MMLALSACIPTPSIPGEVQQAPAIIQNQKTTTQEEKVIDVFESQDLFVNIYEKVNPGVVAIQIITANGSNQGSGFVYDNQGHIITNYHVVENAVQIEVNFPSGFRAWAKVVGTDLDSDIAVIKLENLPPNLTVLELGSSSDLKVGQTVVAIGNPFGLSSTMTTGIVSARGRTLDSMRSAPGGGYFTAADLIQTDAAINPGNSGGPLLDLNGRVVGINRAIRTSDSVFASAVNSGVGFAVPVDIVKQVVPSLISEGKYDYPYLGITSRDELLLVELEALGLPADTMGAYVISVAADGPADKAGMRGGTQPTEFQGLPAGGDLIIALDGQPVRNFSELLSFLVLNKQPGDAVNITVLRNGRSVDLRVILATRPQ